jgi:hypothetical protein
MYEINIHLYETIGKLIKTESKGHQQLWGRELVMKIIA